MSKIESNEDPLSHLSDADKAVLAKKYDDGENVRNLLDEFKVPCSINTLVKYLPAEELSEKCPSCKSSFSRKRVARSTSACRTKNEACCTNCGHIKSGLCRCDYCESRKEEASDKITKSIDDFCHQWWNYSNVTLRADELSLQEAVYLLSMAKSCGFKSVESYELAPYGSSKIPFSPTDELNVEIADLLIASKLISPSNNSILNAFIFDHGEAINFNHPAVNWKCHVYDLPGRIDQVRELVLSKAWPENWRNNPGSLQKLIRDCAIAESKQYYLHYLHAEGLPNPGNKATNDLVEDILLFYSVSQSARIFWIGAKQAKAYKMKARISAQRASNASIGFCREYADHATETGKRIEGFSRISELPRSALSLILHGMFLSHGDNGFTSIFKPPVNMNKIQLPEDVQLLFNAIPV